MKDRDYNTEFRDSDSKEDGRRYAYGFDYDVLHPYMLRSFEPSLREGSMLELGCFKGEFTKRLAEKFDRNPPKK
ncbi:hypothetical protein N9M46_01105 [Gammaproteobacteria bacterium]|nr:hypothetical protein [Gammaproteobacteria bacterium]